MEIKNIILIIMCIFVLYVYIKKIFKLIKDKKKVLPIMMIILLVILTAIQLFIRRYISREIRNTILYLEYIVAIIGVPVIILGYSILSTKKYRIVKIIVSCILILYTYFANFGRLLEYAKYILINIPVYSLQSDSESKEINIDYLKNYSNKIEKNGYLSKYDITQILEYTDKKSAKMNVHYKDEIENIEINITNKQDEEMKNLSDSLKAEYYNFYYKKDEENNIDIYISRYITETEEFNEKNSDIVLSGKENKDIIKEIEKYGTEEGSESFSFKNDVLVQENLAESKVLKTLRVLFVYDKELENFIPVVDDEQEYSLIEKYKVDSGGIQISLKDGVTIENTDYTVRVNRYDTDLNVYDKNIINNGYLYDYDPVVTELKNEKQNIVLDIRFDRTYVIDELKNIEVILGK